MSWSGGDCAGVTQIDEIVFAGDDATSIPPVADVIERFCRASASQPRRRAPPRPTGHDLIDGLQNASWHSTPTAIRTKRMTIANCPTTTYGVLKFP